MTTGDSYKGSDGQHRLSDQVSANTAEDDRQPPRFSQERHVEHDGGLAQRHQEEKPQPRQAVVDGRRADAAFDQMQPVAAQILRARRVRRGPEERAEAFDGADVTFLRPRCELADRHVFDHPPTERTDGGVGHGVLPELGLNTQSSASSPLAVTALPIAPGTRLRAALYRESGLVLRRVSPIAVGLGEGRFCNRMIAVNFLFNFLRGVGTPTPLPLGESGASSVKGGSERRVSAAWMPLTETGRSPGATQLRTRITSTLTWPDPASVRGQPDTWLPHDGGPRDRSSKLTLRGHTNGFRHSMPRGPSRT